MIKALATGTLLALAAVSSHAEEQDRGWLLGAAAAFGDYKLDNESIDDTSVGFQVTAQYRFNRWFGLEGAYLNFGEFEEDTNPQDPATGDAEVNVDGYSFSAVAYLPVSGDDLAFYGKAGLYTLDQDLDVDGESGSTRKAEGLTAGAGLRIAVSEQFSIRTEGNWYDLEDADFWAVNLGLDYHFGN